MKKYDFVYCFIFLFLLLFLAIPYVHADLPLTGKVIYIDPGHGGVDPGSVAGTIYEKDINLAISKKLASKLVDFGATVHLTRDGDYDLGSPNATYRKKSDFDQRIKRINESKTTYYLSIHLNMLQNSKYSGAQVFYNEKNAINQTLAAHVQKIINEKLQGEREIEKIPSSTYMYSKLQVPGLLIECGFLSNTLERQKLLTGEYQEELASVIAESLATFPNP